MSSLFCERDVTKDLLYNILYRIFIIDVTIANMMAV